MPYPFFYVPYAGVGTIIGLEAVIHVIIAQGVAVGAFAVVLAADWADMIGFRGQGENWGRFARRFLKFIVVVSTAAGAATGAGIWFTIAPLASRGTASMLRVFFWPWFIEWLFFITEVIWLLVFYYLWDRLQHRRVTRIWLGAGYLFVSFWTAFLITGILGFMLTPGGWPENRSFFEAFFNPTFAPQLFARLSIAMIIGSILAMFFALVPKYDRRFKDEAARIFGLMLGASVLFFAASVFYYSFAIPRAYTASALFSVLTRWLSQSPWLFVGVNAAGFGLLMILAAAATLKLTAPARRLLVPAFLVAVGLVAEFERIREFIRGPYLMPGHMYVGGVLMREKQLFDREGMLTHSPWYQRNYPRENVLAAGAYVFSSNCAVCHTMTGINGIQERVQGRSEDGIYVILGRTHEMVPFMPPLAASDEERRAVARFLHETARGRGTVASGTRNFTRTMGFQPMANAQNAPAPHTINAHPTRENRPQ